MAAPRAPGGLPKGGPKKMPQPTIRPDFIMGSRPENMRAPLPGARIKPMAGQRDYGKPLSGPGVGTFDQGPL